MAYMSPHCRGRELRLRQQGCANLSMQFWAGLLFQAFRIATECKGASDSLRLCTRLDHNFHFLSKVLAASRHTLAPVSLVKHDTVLFLKQLGD